MEEKSRDLYSLLCSRFTNEYGWVLDFYAGTFTSAIGAVVTNRYYLGFESGAGRVVALPAARFTSVCCAVDKACFNYAFQRLLTFSETGPRNSTSGKPLWAHVLPDTWPEYCCPTGVSPDVDAGRLGTEWGTEPSQLEMTAAHAEAEELGLQIRRSHLRGATLGLYKRTRGEPREVIGHLWGWQVFSPDAPTVRFPRARYYPPPFCRNGYTALGRSRAASWALAKSRLLGLHRRGSMWWRADAAHLRMPTTPRRWVMERQPRILVSSNHPTVARTCRKIMRSLRSVRCRALCHLQPMDTSYWQ